VADIDEATKYWRDQVDLLLKAGGALVILFAGWAIEHQETFDLGCFTGSRDDDKRLAAIGLLIMSFAYAISLPVMVSRIYKHRLASKTDPTLLGKGTAVWISFWLSAASIVIAVLMSVR
jgi:hypothetical protein